MSLFDYRCYREHSFTEIHNIGEAPDWTKCPECGGQSKRVISAPALSFPGGTGAGYIKR